MGKLTRFGVSLDEELLEPFDALCAVKGYSNRSEAIRDLIRKALVAEEWHQADGQGAGTLTLVYDHTQERSGPPPDPDAARRA